MALRSKHQVVGLAVPGMPVQSQLLNPFVSNSITKVQQVVSDSGIIESYLVWTIQDGPYVFKPGELLRWPRRLDGSNRAWGNTPVSPNQLAVEDTLAIPDFPNANWRVESAQPLHHGQALVTLSCPYGARSVTCFVDEPMPQVTLEAGSTLQQTKQRNRVRQPSPTWYPAFGPYLVPGHAIWKGATDLGVSIDGEPFHVVMLIHRIGTGRWPRHLALPDTEFVADEGVLYRRAPARGSWLLNDPDRPLLVGSVFMRHPQDPEEGFPHDFGREVTKKSEELLGRFERLTEKMQDWRSPTPTSAVD